ncbi:MAG: hypothetical protein HY878_04700, partial [Deltaproteobacteria bacterium]|nr:hypothetical protein [Deltaproteobacteria bacterium]
MLSKGKTLEGFSSILKSQQTDALEIVATRRRQNTIRFSNSSFHQGLSESDCKTYIRVVKGRRIGVASTNSLEKGSLKRCLKKAVVIASHTKEEPFSLRLPGPSPYAQVSSWFESTSEVTDRDKVNILSRGFKKAERNGCLQSGIFRREVGELAVVNTNGVEAYHPYTVAHLSVVTTKEESSGLRSAVVKDISSLDFHPIKEDSIERCLKGLSPKDIEPGVYRVLFEPHAVSELVRWLSYLGFGAKNLQEGTSFLSGAIGKRVTGKRVTLYDDGLDLRGMAVPFDMEGIPKKRFP